MDGLSLTAVEICITFIAICAALCTTCCIILLYQLHGSGDIHICTKILLTLCTMGSTLCTSSDLVRWIFCYTTHQSLFSFPLNQILSLADLFYYIGCISFYLIAISRIYYAFRNSYYEIS